MEPLISVIIPVYKVEQYLSRCVDSVLDQTYQNLEIILVDDGSPDRCPAICDEYAEKDARIKVIHKANAGPGEARNTGIDNAAGEYLLFLDSDDYLALDAIASFYERMVADDSDMVVGRFAMLYDDGVVDEKPTEWMKDAVYTGKQVIEQMSDERQLAPAPWGKLYKKELFRGLRYPKALCGEDLWLFPQLLEKCNRVSVLDRITVFYYQRSTSITNVYNERARRDNLEVHLYITRFLLEHGAFDGAVRWYEISIQRAFAVIKRKDARKLYRQYMDFSTNKKLLQQQTWKLQLMWLSMYVPFLKKAIQHRLDRHSS